MKLPPRKPQAQFDVFLSYHDLKDQPKGFTLVPPPKAGDRLIKEGVFPGMFGYSTIYISHVRGKWIMDGDEENPVHVLVISYTEVPMTQELHDGIIKRAWDFFSKKLGLQ